MTPVEVFMEHIASDSSPTIYDEVECLCGAEFDTNFAYGTHVFAAFADAGYAVIKVERSTAAVKTGHTS